MNRRASQLAGAAIAALGLISVDLAVWWELEAAIYGGAFVLVVGVGIVLYGLIRGG